MDEVSLSLSALFTFFLTWVSNAGSFQCQSSLEVKNTPLPSAGAPWDRAPGPCIQITEICVSSFEEGQGALSRGGQTWGRTSVRS